MRIVQTFWSGNRSLTYDGFGWSLPENHLMSWALSCISLRNHYENVVLYTDSEGYKILIEKLKLPYSDVKILYDKIVCPPSHWAYTKLLTYSYQNEPFLHVDGDVYLAKSFPSFIFDASLVAQNREISTEYYGSMVKDFLNHNFNLPDWFQCALQNRPVDSYNAGVLGGGDLSFIQEYCDTAFRLLADNKLLDDMKQGVSINNNIIFEQILFASLAKLKNKVVTTVIDHPINDNGYSFDEFCNLFNFQNQYYFHIIGGHKKNTRVCDMLGKTLLRLDYDIYYRIISLFPQRHERFGNTSRHFTSDISIQACIAQYQDFLCTLNESWLNISNNDLMDWDYHSAFSFSFINATEGERLSFVIKKHPYMRIFSIPQHWHPIAKNLIKTRLGGNNNNENYDIVVFPTILDKGVKEIIIDDLAYNILLVLDKANSFGSLLKVLDSCFSDDIKKVDGLSYKLIMNEMKLLLNNNIISVSQINKV